MSRHDKYHPGHGYRVLDILKDYGSDYFTSLVATVQSLIDINVIASEYFVYDHEKTLIFLTTSPVQ